MAKELIDTETGEVLTQEEEAEEETTLAEIVEGERDTDAELREIYDRRAEAEAESIADSEQAKASKKRLEAVTDELVRAVGKRVHPPAAPLFDQPPGDIPAVAADAALDTLLADLTGPDGFTLSPRVLRALAECLPPILTVRELTTWQKDKGQFWAKDIDGLGEVGAGRLDEAMLAFWRKHPQPQPPACEDDE